MAALRRWFVCGVSTGLLALGTPATAAAIEWVVVGSPGNPSDPDLATQLCGAYEDPCGAVASYYRIGKYEVTNAQYAEFLNAVAADDANGLYDPDMGSLLTYGGITRSGSPGSYSYAVISGRADHPVNNVSWYSAARFANWLHNGQPTGAQGNATTENGAYVMPDPSARNSGASFFLPSENEWYKAAYYSGAGASYHDYPAASDTPIACSAATATPNSANCDDAVGDLVAVGSYTGSASPAGTYDQGGNVYEWNETDVFGDLGARANRGGALSYPAVFAGAAEKTDFVPIASHPFQGFRVAPEPGSVAMLFAGALGVALLGKLRR